MLTSEQISFYEDNGYLHVPGVFDPEETKRLGEAMDELVQTWAWRQEWTGPWREALMDPELAGQIELTTMHDLQAFSAEWARAVMHPRLTDVLVDLLGPDVEFHHTTMHIKPPEKGQPFPMHQDHPFYRHLDNRFIAVLAHLDDTNHENGEIRFLPGSHKQGGLNHIQQTADGPCTPHLPTDVYKLDDTVPVPAKAGDIVCMNICTIHGSYLNTTPHPRRLVRMGYRHPDNTQVDGQGIGRAGLMVRGNRPKPAANAFAQTM